MRISYNNYADTGTISCNASAVTDYPLTNVQDQRLSTTFRTTTLSSVTFTITFSAARTISTVAILGHNLTSAATITYTGNNADTITSLPTALKFVGTDAFYLTTEADEKLITEASDYLTTETDHTIGYLTITDAANTDGYLEIGRIWLGDYITVDPSSLIDFKVTKKRSDTVIYGKNRQKWSTPGVGWRKFELNFPESAYSMINQIETMFDAVGNHQSIIFCNFDIIRDYAIVEPCYCSINDEIAFSHGELMRFKYTLVLEEDK